jgi:hypothetical protein
MTGAQPRIGRKTLVPDVTKAAPLDVDATPAPAKKYDGRNADFDKSIGCFTQADLGEVDGDPAITFPEQEAWMNVHQNADSHRFVDGNS